jgi:hypothetical protein
LRKLNEAIDRAVQERVRPPTPEEGVRAIGPIETYLDDAAVQVLWRTIADLGEFAPDVYNRYVGEHFLRSVIVEIVAETDGPVDWEGLISQLEHRADTAGRWLLGVPLANILPPQAYCALGDGVGLGLAVQAPDWSASDDAPVDPFAMYRHLKDRLTAGVRWRREDQPGGPLDTRRTAVLFQVQEGTQTAALAVAEARAQYALGMWCLLRPPEYYELWPALATWEPRPHMQHDIEHKLYEPDKWVGGETPRGRNITHREEYRLPSDERLLKAPFRALELVHERLSARAVLSAASSLHLAEREPRELQRTDELLMLSAAIEAICDIGEGTSAGGERRWARVTERYGIWRELRGPYSQNEIEQAKQLSRDLRNIAAHGADDVLVNLGYPPHLPRRLPGGREVRGSDLALARAVTALPVVRHAVRAAIARLAHESIDNDWDDAWFRKQFA